MSTSSHQIQNVRRRIAGRWGKLLFDRRRAFEVILGLVSLAALLGLVQLRFDSEPRTLFQRSDEDFQLLNEYFEHFGADDNEITVILRSSSLFSSQFSAALREFTRAANEVPGVESVLSILDVPDEDGSGTLMPPPDAPPSTFAVASKEATDHPFVTGQLVSPDGESMLVIINLKEDGPQTIDAVRPTYEQLREIRDEIFGLLPVEALFAGSVAIRVETLAGMRQEFFKITALGVLFAVAVALLLFRNLTTALVVAAAPGIAVFWTLGFMGWMGLAIEGLSTPIPAIVFVVAFANSVHLMLEMRICRRRGHSPEKAARVAVRRLGLACVLTSVTTTIGFGSLLLAETTSVQRFGLATGLGSLLGLIANMTVAPLLAARSKRLPGDGARAHVSSVEHFFAAFGFIILRHSKAIALTALVCTGVLLLCASQLKSDIIWTETLPADAEVTRAMAHADEEFGGALEAFVVVGWNENVTLGGPEFVAVLEEIEQLISADPTFQNALSILDFFPQPTSDETLELDRLALAASRVPRSVITHLIRPDLRRTVVATRLPNQGAAATRPAFLRMNQDLASLESLHPGFSIHLTGSAVVAAENMTSVIGDLLRSLTFASLTVFLVLTITLRSLTLGLLSIIPNAFPLLLNAGLLFALGKPLQITSVLTFSICLGIAVDDTIHFLIRFLRERHAGASVREAILHAFQRVGAALLITTAIIAGGFLAAMTSNMPGLVFFGALACSALFAALLGDLIILPALLHRVVGRKENLAHERRRRAENL